MVIEHKGLRILSIILFVFGVLVGLTLGGLTIWANLEASLFDADMPGDTRLNLQCPTMITTDETGILRATFTNTATWDVILTVNAHISQGYISLYREELTRLPLAPGESQEVTWEVTADKLVYGRFIFVRIANHRLAPIEGKMGTCGILVVDLPGISGMILLIVTIVASLVFMGSGYAIWRRLHRQISFGPALEAQRAMTWLMVVVLAAIICGLSRAWLPGIIVFVVALLLIAEILHHYTQGKENVRA